MSNITTNPKLFITIRAADSQRVPPGSAIRVMDQELYVTAFGISVRQGEHPDPFQVRHCEAWLKRFARPRKSINFDIGSYGLKHIVEKWPFEGETWPGRGYCTNGSFIQAALNLGYKFLPFASERSPNCHFNIRLRKNRKWRERVFEHKVYLPWDDETGGAA